MLKIKQNSNPTLKPTPPREVTLLIRYSLWILTITSTLFILSVLYFDLPVALYFNKPELSSVYYYSREVTNIGYSIHYFVIAIIGVIFSKLFYFKIPFLNQKISPAQNSLIYQWSVFTIKCLTIIGLLLNFIKLSVGRTRPHASPDFYNLGLDFFTTNPHNHSFPSGHSQVLFSVATIAYLIWPKYKYLFLTVASIFALTRVTIHQHFLSDIIAGGLIGHLGTLWLYIRWSPKLNIK